MLALLQLKRAGALGLALNDPRSVKIIKTAVTTFPAEGQYLIQVHSLPIREVRHCSENWLENKFISTIKDMEPHIRKIKDSDCECV